MAKFSAIIGYEMQVEDPNAPSVFVPEWVERPCRGDVLANETKWQEGNSAVSGSTANEDLILQNRFSIVSDTFATSNLGYMRWIKWHGIKWRIKSVRVNGPRIVIAVGGVYSVSNGSYGP